MKSVTKFVRTSLLVLLLVIFECWNCNATPMPAEGLTPFKFFMARAMGQSNEHSIMKIISFKPDDGAKFRQIFEKKHGPKGRDLIESLGKGITKGDTEKDDVISKNVEFNV
ncbi:uncharacterized protein LOC126904641 [Daktulosphaira vitifoliae]|uniref:uncharacterized protein LOC126904641 n=1 Tax=Daktulosphaira vitifoliae TaxID=58002 RepID=UPI0021A9A70C|nr:uncharacterized protein LOC126904641 [Daktulosphaira vitifoliae]